MEKTFRTRDGALSVKLTAPETPVPNGGWRSEPREYDWETIVGALREAIRYLHENRQVLQSLNPASDRSSFLLASSARHKLGHIWTILYHSFGIDPRRDDGVCVEQHLIGDILYLCLQEQRDLQFAAGNLWRVYSGIAESLKDPFGESLDYGKLGELERAVEAVARLTVDTDDDSPGPPERFVADATESRVAMRQSSPANDPCGVSVWEVEAGGFKFKGTFYAASGVPLSLLKVFLESPRLTTFGYTNLRAAWDEESDPTEDTIRAQLSKLRYILRQVAANTGIALSDPLPGSNGAWRFELPR